MPIYEYRCKRGHTFEVMQRMSDDALAQCTTCGDTVQRVFHPVAVHFKGSGFYTTDYGRKNSKGAKEAKSDGASPDSSSNATSSSSDSKPSRSDSKPSSSERASAKSD